MTIRGLPNPVPIAPPLDGVMEIDTLADRPRGALLSPESPIAIALEVRDDGAQWVCVEGFSAAGKTNFAARLAHHLGWQHVELDGLVHGRELDSDSYADFIDEQKLTQFLGTREARTHVVLDGVCLREVLDRVGPVEPAFVVYVGRVGRPTPNSSSLLWHDGLHMENPTPELP